MIEKINALKKGSQNNKVIALCEKAIATVSSGIYNNIPEEAKSELEKAVIEGLFEDLSSIDDEFVNEWLLNTKRIWTVKNLGVKESVNALLASEAKDNLSLKTVLEQYRDALQKDPEVLLYESFISSLQSFKYFPKVGNAVQAIKDKVDNYEADVSLTKILETMKRTKSHYLVPLIEDLIQNYLDNKNMQTKSSLKEGLMKFSYDDFVRDIINIVSADATELQLEYANAQCDIEKVYSPILYLGENEGIFGIRGSYYVKKGNTVARLNKENTAKLDPEFTALCEAINSRDVIISNKDITIYEGSDKAVITEDKILVNNKEFTNEEYKNSAEIVQWTGKAKFLSLVETFRSNFNEIAEIDFAKRVFLKENIDYAADIFKLRGNVSITTFDPQINKGTFYRNVNPIQAKNLMMEHLRFDVSNAFKEILPNEKKINDEINETKSAYSKYITNLETKINEFKSSPYAKEANEEVIIALEEELVDVQNEYKDYLNLVEGYMKAPKEDLNEATVSLDIDGPLTITVGGQKYSVPIPQEAEGEITPEIGEEPEIGTEVGVEDVEGTDGLDIADEPASAITFDDSETELLGDSPTMQSDMIDLGSDSAEADADAAEADAELATRDAAEVTGEEGSGEEGDLGEPGEADTDISGDDDEGEIKIDDEELDIEDAEGSEKEDKEDKEDKEEKIEDSTSNRKAPKKAKRKVYLKKKKS